ncbi:hypothetical protein BH11MYX1_BH11MYX1_21710 [soil metagenome]
MQINEHGDSRAASKLRRVLRSRRSLLVRTTLFAVVVSCGTTSPDDALQTQDLELSVARIQAEDFIPGPKGTAYHDLTAGNTGGAYRATDVDIETTTDAGGGYNVGWMEAGEWLAYDVTLPTASSYTFALRVASESVGTKVLHVEVDGTDVSGPVSYTDSSGWQSWQTVRTSASPLGAGAHRIKVVVDTAGFNLNYLDVKRVGPRFAGDPGVGKFYIGANNPTHSAGMPIVDFESMVIAPRHTSVVRVYNPNKAPGTSFGFNRTATSAAVAAGKIPLTSFIEGPYSLAQVANGAADRDIQDNITYLKSLAPHVVWVSYHHEPENDFVTPEQQTLYRAASRRINLAIKAAGMSHVAVVGPIYMGGTARNPHRDWRSWNPDWDGTKWISASYDLEGWDYYDPQVGAAIRKQYNFLVQPFIDMILADRPGDFRPFVIGEMGIKAMRSLPDPDFLPVSGRPHTNTLAEEFQDIEANVDKLTDGVPTQCVAICMFLAGPESEALQPYANPQLPASTVAEVNSMNPAGWPDASYYPVHDFGGYKKAALNTYLMASPKRVDY